MKAAHLQKREFEELQSDYDCVMQEHRKKQNGIVTDKSTIESQVRQYTACRKQRIAQFLEHIKNKRETALANLYTIGEKNGQSVVAL